MRNYDYGYLRAMTCAGLQTEKRADALSGLAALVTGAMAANQSYEEHGNVGGTIGGTAGWLGGGALGLAAGNTAVLAIEKALRRGKAAPMPAIAGFLGTMLAGTYGGNAGQLAGGHAGSALQGALFKKDETALPEG